MSANLEIGEASSEAVTAAKPVTAERRSKGSKGLTFRRVFSQEGIHPFDRITWSRREAVISNERGETVFKQENVEVPEFWTQMATNVVVSKYFRGTMGTPQREYSVKQLVSRVADTISAWGRKDGYFATDEQAKVFNEELTTLLVEQYGAFNSPVWFNVGVEEHPQCSACFILSVEDRMESLLELQQAEAMLFKYGSGAGSNLSKIRSSKELLSGGGIPSGPVSFMRGYDAWAGTIKSGGKTRRAAKMQILDADHPDIFQFVHAKRLEEEKAWALIEEGYDGGFNVPGGAYDSVYFQNSNLSVRVTDEFMRAAIERKQFATIRRTDNKLAEHIEAHQLLHDIAYGTWVCGDPGLQFDTTINDWHTCPNSGRINASNPCSEYMHLDDSACNLASINLLKFLRDDGSFDVDRYLHAVDVFITAQDILVDNASYPTEKIGKNAKAFRELGLGYANLGAVLMCKGLPYDSDEGRAYAAALTALLCGRAYLQSAKIAEKLGAFTGYKPNDKPMLRVMEKHLEAAVKLPRMLVTDTLSDKAQEVWEEALAAGRKHGYRNSQATVLAPTGTIAFLMDCDTTGVEPDIALVKYKKLVGGGMLKIVNQSVPRALRTLGYGEDQIKAVVDYIAEHDTIEGAPDLDESHLPVFDCAFKPMNGERFIQYMGHVRMMAAAQPFISGAISKTVNLPENATVEDIYETYVEAWKLGLKAIAIYRDNSKRSQPLATAKEKEKTQASVAAEVAGVMQRRKLPDERQAITHKFNIAGHEGYITVGLYDDGSPGEIFLVMAKEGSTLSGVMDAFATSISLALQYGVPLGALVQKFSHMRFEPSGFTHNKQIPFAKSILDYIFRWLGSKFCSPEEQAAIGIQAVEGESKGVTVAAKKPAIQEDLSDNTPRAVAVQGAPAAIGFQTTEAKTVTAHGSNGNGKKTDYTMGEIKSLGFMISDDAPPCHVCGSGMMVRQGACYRCLNCGSQGGCG